MSQSTGSLLLGLDGIVVESVTVGDDDGRTVHVGTAGEWVGTVPAVPYPIVAVAGLGDDPAT